MKKFISIISFLLIISILSCDKSTEPVEVIDDSDIPADPTNVVVPSTNFNNLNPSANFDRNTKSRNRIIMNVTGLINPITFTPIEFVPQINLFVTENNVVKGLKVTKVGHQNKIQADIVFTIDNSGSMGQESDSIAAGIIKFAKLLQSLSLDARFGIVGYNGKVLGAINFTDASSIESYLNRDTLTGAQRTIGFIGTDRLELKNRAKVFASEIIGENGVVGVLFADSNFSWRSSAQRVFINFTDEPTQSINNAWNTELVCRSFAGQATVHTVFSKDSTAYKWDENNERPWDMSICTGGTYVFIDENAINLNLLELPVAGVLANSYLVEFMSKDGGSAHNLDVTIIDSYADGKRVYSNIKY